MEQSDRRLIPVSDITEALIEQTIWIRARLHTCRGGGKRCFLILRDRSDTIQAMVHVNQNISLPTLKFITGLPAETILDLQGELARAPELIGSCSQNRVELHVIQAFVVSRPECRLPLSVADTRDDPMLFNKLDYRTLDLRRPTNQAIFRLAAAVCQLFREILDREGFLEIHTPKIHSELLNTHADLFSFNYFQSPAYLAFSSQYYRQLAIAADFERVYTVGTVFRAHPATTHRHLTEFIALDLEMTFGYHYHEVLETIERLFTRLFQGLEARLVEQKIINTERFRFIEPSLRLEYKDAIALLTEEGIAIGLGDDLTVERQHQLGRIIRTKYDTDFYIVDKYPSLYQPFFLMIDPDRPTYSNSFRACMRGVEVFSGGQHIHDLSLLLERAGHCQIDPDSIQFYLNAFRAGCAPHAGGSLGLERFVTLYLGLHNVRHGSMFPRDDKRLTP